MRASRQAGFTLAELMVTLLILTVLILGVLAMFDFAAKMSRSQTQLAGLQQAQRIAQHELVRMARMAGRGGVVAARALEIRNDSPADEPILVGGGSSVPRVAEHSDVVVVRGIFGGEIYQLNTNDESSFSFNAADGTGTLAIRSTSPSGVPQPVDPLAALLDTGGEEGIPEAILVVSAVDDSFYTVIELDPAAGVVAEDSSTTPPGQLITLGFVTQNGVNTDAYAALSTAALDAPQMQSVAYAGVLEEYRFYVRDQAAAAGVPGSARATELARARVYPGTEAAYRDDPANLALTVAEDVLDLQAALGVDKDGDGNFFEGTTEAAKKDDEWNFNVAGDTVPVGAVGMVRLTTLARAGRPDPKYEAALLTAAEDRAYADDLLNTDRIERLYRRWPMQSVVDLRNL